MTYCCCKPRYGQGFGVAIVSLGLTLVLLATFLPPYADKLLEQGLDEGVFLTKANYDKQTKAWTQWIDPTTSDVPPTFYRARIFNLTNPQAVLNGGVPIVTEHGPYTYREYKKRLDITFSRDFDGHEVMSFKTYLYYVFDADNSAPGVKETDAFFVPSFPVQIVAAHAEESKDFLVPLFDQLPDLQRLARLTTVSELLWGGMADFPLFPGLVGNMTSPDEAKAQPPQLWYTGAEDGSLNRVYKRWVSNNVDMDYLTVPTSFFGPPFISPWDSPAANRVYGTDGKQFRRNLKQGDTVVAWVEELFRAVPITNMGGEMITLKGIDLLRFTLDPEVLANTTANPSNAAFRMDITGSMDVSACELGVPIRMTKPHFLDLSAEVAKSVIGLSPDRLSHDTFIDVEPRSGASMHASKRLQVNMHMKPLNLTAYGATSVWLSNVRDLPVLPVAWLEEGGEISDDLAKDFRDGLKLAHGISYYMLWIGVIAGSILIVLGLGLGMCCACRQYKPEDSWSGAASSGDVSSLISHKVLEPYPASTPYRAF